MALRRGQKLTGGKCADPIWKAERSRKAAAVNHRRWWAGLHARCEQFPHKASAFKAGYRLGYFRAYRAWKRHAEAIRKQAA
jgi:hypothetical protein